jgi:hypothetical protein
LISGAGTAPHLSAKSPLSSIRISCHTKIIRMHCCRVLNNHPTADCRFPPRPPPRVRTARASRVQNGKPSSTTALPMSAGGISNPWAKRVALRGSCVDRFFTAPNRPAPAPRPSRRPNRSSPAPGPTENRGSRPPSFPSARSALCHPGLSQSLAAGRRIHPAAGCSAAA